MVADGHKTDTPCLVTYISAVSRDSVRICLLLAASNDLDDLSGDIENTYLTVPCREKYLTIGGKEISSNQDKSSIIMKALYELKSSGTAFRVLLVKTFDDMGFRASHADPDVWVCPTVKPDEERYYEYVLVHVDNILL